MEVQNLVYEFLLTFVCSLCVGSNTRFLASAQVICGHRQTGFIIMFFDVSFLYQALGVHMSEKADFPRGVILLISCFVIFILRLH